MSVVRLIVATRSSGPSASGIIIKEMPGSVASGTPYILYYPATVSLRVYTEYNTITDYRERSQNVGKC